MQLDTICPHSSILYFFFLKNKIFCLCLTGLLWLKGNVVHWGLKCCSGSLNKVTIMHITNMTYSKMRITANLQATFYMIRSWPYHRWRLAVINQNTRAVNLSHLFALVSTPIANLLVCISIIGRFNQVTKTAKTNDNICIFQYNCMTYHRFRWYSTLEIKTPAETFPKFPLLLRVIDISDRNPPITAR